MKMTLNRTFIKNTRKGINDKKFRWNYNPVYIWFTWDEVVLYEIDMDYNILDYFESKGVPISETLNTSHIIKNARVVLDDQGQLFTIEDFNHVLKHRRECYMLKSGDKRYYFDKKYINKFLKANYQYSIFEWDNGIYGVMVYQYETEHNIPAFNDLLSSIVFICGVRFLWLEKRKIIVKHF